MGKFLSQIINSKYNLWIQVVVRYPNSWLQNCNQLTTGGRKGMDEGISGISSGSSTPLSSTSFMLFNLCCTLNLLTYTHIQKVCPKQTNITIQSRKNYHSYNTNFQNLQELRHSNLFHEEKDLIPSAPYIVLNLLWLHLNKILNRLRSFYDAKVTENRNFHSNQI